MIGPSMNLKHEIFAIGCAVACALVLAVPAGAQQTIVSRWLTFNTPVRLPGITLGAGTYLFERLPSATTQQLVRVTRKEGNIAIGIFQVTPSGVHVTSGPEVTMWEIAPGVPPAVLTLCLGTQDDRYEFLYSPEQKLAMRRQLAPTLVAGK